MTNTYRRIMAVATGQLGLLSRQQPYQFSYDHVVDAPTDVVATTAVALRGHP